MGENLSKLVIERLARAMGVPAESLTLNTELGDEIWEDEVVESLCIELGVDPTVLFPPENQSPRSELAVAGLRRLAPFSHRAAQRLAEMECRWEIMTLGSLIRSIEERRHVASGRFVAVADRPLAPSGTVARFAAWTAGIGGALSLGLWSDCNPACGICLPLADVTAHRGLPIALALVGGWHVLILGAAVRDLVGTRGVPARV